MGRVVVVVVWNEAVAAAAAAARLSQRHAAERFLLPVPGRYRDRRCQSQAPNLACGCCWARHGRRRMIVCVATAAAA